MQENGFKVSNADFIQHILYTPDQKWMNLLKIYKKRFYKFNIINNGVSIYTKYK